ncbi:MAG: hypothetical protein H5T60_04915 [Anaerolineae bacterium]|nr:hypothetical protein [Anaerolineae bacterium]
MEWERREVRATLTPAGEALVELAGRQLLVRRKIEVAVQAAGLCPVELIGVALAS